MISRDKDVFGAALKAYKTTKNDQLQITVNQPEFDLDTLPVPYLFRTLSQMPIIEKKALKLCTGNTLDVGCGSGCHTLELEKKGIPTFAIDNSPIAIDLLLEEGKKNVQCTDILNFKSETKFDTILMLMNGIGIAGNIEGLQKLLKHFKSLLSPNGKILIDSSDLKYLFEDEDGSFLIPMGEKYYGETQYQLAFQDITGDWFDWLFIDFETLDFYATPLGFKCKKIMDGENFDYLAELTLS